MKTPIFHGPDASHTRTEIDQFSPDYAQRNDRYLTPLPIIHALGPFDLDPAGAPGHPTAAEVWTPESVGDGLSMPWHGRVWLNPPYGRTMPAWIERLAHHDHGTALIFARTGTRMFQRWVFPHAAGLLFLSGRVAFIDTREAPGRPGITATAPSVLVAYGTADAAALELATLAGRYVPLT